ncbi:MAG TPA: CdaR family protein [Blastocatellia bacterium]|nr:CdaR family protein [Blastocatellia bacterium]HMV81721.1 CdaR family protein [Blastocatellia bacterium]HMZ17817.1 CdaR family protein [Blastocatellia bacterium]HNG29679.1 CdaR family protein [Blastocatellia bacterium]
MTRTGRWRQLSPSRLWRRVRHIHIEHKGLKLLALALAILLFAVSRQPLSDVKLFNVPLEYRGLGSNLEISGDVEQTVSVRVRGPRDLVRSLTPAQLSVVADLANKEPGERVVQLHSSDVSLPDNNIEVVQIEPASIRLLLEPKLRKRVRVEAQFMGQLADGLEIYRISAEPAEIDIEGPQSQLNKVGRLLTETVNLSGHSEDFQALVDVETPHKSLRVLTPSPIRLTVQIGERRGFHHFSGVPVYWGDQLAGGRLLTSTVDVELFGPNSVLNALQAKDLRAEINGERDGNDSVRPNIILPPNADKRIEIKNIIPNEVKIKK